MIDSKIINGFVKNNDGRNSNSNQYKLILSLKEAETRVSFY